MACVVIGVSYSHLAIPMVTQSGGRCRLVCEEFHRVRGLGTDGAGQTLCEEFHNI